MQEDIGGERIHLSSTSCAYKPCYIGKNLDVGENVSIGSMCHIGRNVTIGDGTRIQGSNYIADRTVIGSTVFIGPNSTILNDKYPPSGDGPKTKSDLLIAAKAFLICLLLISGMSLPIMATGRSGNFSNTRSIRSPRVP